MLDLSKGNYKIRVNPTNAQAIAYAFQAGGARRYGDSSIFDIDEDSLPRITALFLQNGMMTHSYAKDDSTWNSPHAGDGEELVYEAGELHLKSRIRTLEQPESRKMFLLRRVAQLASAVSQHAAEGVVPSPDWIRELSSLSIEIQHA